MRETLVELRRAGAELHFVSCAASAQPNLAVTKIEPGVDTRAAGVPLFCNVEVKNFGTSAARRVQLKVRSYFYDPDQIASGEVDRAVGEAEDLPATIIDEIAAGKTETRRVAVFFPKPGKHVVEASLVDDALNGDNRRWCVVDVPEGAPVLLVDGTPQQKHAYFLESAFRPGPRANTGIMPLLKRPEFLRDATAKDLTGFQVIYLLDVQRLDDRALENLEGYVREGGGLAIFVGDNVVPSAYNDKWYKGGTGLLPLPLDRQDVLPERNEEASDIEVGDHPIFRAFLGENNPFIRLVSISKYIRPRPDWIPPTDSTVQVIARLRNRQPLAVEQRFGEGRVVVFLTSLAPESLDSGWNNWAQDPSFIVTQLKLQSYLAAGQARFEQHLVGDPIAVDLSATKYQPDMKLVVPGTKPGTRVVLEQRAAKEQDRLRLTVGGSADRIDATARGGIYEVWPETTAGTYEVDRYALNVNPIESALMLSNSDDLMKRLESASIQFHRADEYDWEMGDHGGINRSFLLMLLLVVLLLAEQLLAYYASYHLPTPIPVRGVAR